MTTPAAVTGPVCLPGPRMKSVTLSVHSVGVSWEPHASYQVFRINHPTESLSNPGMFLSLPWLPSFVQRCDQLRSPIQCHSIHYYVPSHFHAHHANPNLWEKREAESGSVPPPSLNSIGRESWKGKMISPAFPWHSDCKLQQQTLALAS